MYYCILKSELNKRWSIKTFHSHLPWFFYTFFFKFLSTGTSKDPPGWTAWTFCFNIIFCKIIGLVYNIFFLLISGLLLNCNWSIVSDITLYIVIPTRRSIASATQILISHAFGDAISPYLIGMLFVNFLV